MRVIGVPFNSAGYPNGVARAPRALRDAGLLARLERSTAATPSAGRPRSPGTTAGEVSDLGDVDVGVSRPDRDRGRGLRALDSLLITTASLRSAVAESVRDRSHPLVIGGDCAVLLGCLRGAADVVGEVGLLFLDGHEDAWPPAGSTTGEAADCELGLALGLHREGLPDALVRLLPTLHPQAVIALGPRDADDLAAHAVPPIAERIAMHTADDIHAAGDSLVALVDDAITRIRRRVEHWWLHVDLDVLSTDALPAVDYPQPGGLSWAQLDALTGTALRAPGCVGITACIFNPDLDSDGRHARSIVNYLGQSCSLLGFPEVAR